MTGTDGVSTLAEGYRNWFAASGEAYFVFEAGERRIVEANAAALRLGGFESGSEVRAGLTLDRLITGPGVNPETLAKLARIGREGGYAHLREGVFLSFQGIENETVDAILVPVELFVTRARAGTEPLGLILARRVEGLARPSRKAWDEEIVDDLFGLTDELACVVGVDGTILRANGTWEGMLGLDPASLVGTPIRRHFSGDGDDWPSTPEGMAPARFTRWLAHRDGSARHVSWRATFRDGLWLGLGHEVRDGKKRAALDDDDPARRAKVEFLANVNHEIRTPMTAILGFVELLLEGCSAQPSTPNCREQLQAIQRNANLMLALFGDMLELTRIEAGEADPEIVDALDLSSCDPSGLIEALADEVRVHARAKGLGFAVENCSPLPARVRTDPARLRRVLAHLADNALKFTDRGDVSLAVAFEPAPTPRLRFEVRDTGIGMSTEESARLFQPFHKGNAPRRRSRGGPGIGLAISRRLTRQLGGTLELLRTRPAAGSSFVLTIPVEVEADAAPRASSEAPTPRPPLSGARVLVAEDNGDNQRIISLRLKMAGADPTLVPNGHEAVESVAAAVAVARPFDLILMDMQMPVLDGYEATRLLRSRGVRTPIVALTAHALPEDRQECLRFGCDEYVSKPIDWELLVGLLSSLRPRGD